MKTVILNGAETTARAPQLLFRHLCDALEERSMPVEPYLLAQMDIAPCTGCFGCWIKTPGRCVIHDASAQVTASLVASDLVVLLTPVTFGGYSYHLKKALDRQIGVISPFFKTVHGETHHRGRYRSPPKLLGLGWMPAADAQAEALFTGLVARNAINMLCPGHAAAVISGAPAREQIFALTDQLLRQLEGA